MTREPDHDPFPERKPSYLLDESKIDPFKIDLNKEETATNKAVNNYELMTRGQPSEGYFFTRSKHESLKNALMEAKSTLDIGTDYVIRCPDGALYSGSIRESDKDDDPCDWNDEDEDEDENRNQQDDDKMSIGKGIAVAVLVAGMVVAAIFDADWTAVACFIGLVSVLD